jgi:predicted nucleic acid-binding protein
MKVILDTGPLVAFLNRDDAHHEWATENLRRLPGPLWTCEPVLTEASHLSRRGETVLEMLLEGAFRVGLELETQSDAILKLLNRYSGQMDLADACVVRMTEIFRDSQVFTLDRTDFAIYRRNGRDVIPVIVPQD